MSDIKSAQCHCGSVVFNVELIDGFNGVLRCNCSLCAKRGAVMAMGKRVEVIKGKDMLTEYRFNSGEAAHFFCKTCGIYTFHQRRSNPEFYGINVACIEGVTPFDFSPVPVSDGLNHPKDGGAGGIAGYISYTPK